MKDANNVFGPRDEPTAKIDIDLSGPDSNGFWAIDCQISEENKPKKTILKFRVTEAVELRSASGLKPLDAHQEKAVETDEYGQVTIVLRGARKEKGIDAIMTINALGVRKQACLFYQFQ